MDSTATSYVRDRVTVTTRPYLDYYAKNKIIPVRQNISDLQIHLKRRSILFYYLKIPPAAVRGQRVLEIGPGTGDNAIHIASLAPKKYTLLDGNPHSIAAVNEKIQDTRFAFRALQDLQCIETDFVQYDGTDLYDLVLCEGIIPAQDDCAAFARRAARFVDIDGLLVVTCHSAISLLSEVCRRLIKPILFSNAEDSARILSDAIELFTPHLEQLPGRSRVIEDWVRDNILQPWPETIVFSIEDALNAVGQEFYLFGTSPQFIQDFRWYKAAAVDEVSLNDLARRQLEYWAPIFIDYRVDPGDFVGLDSSDLESKCRAILRNAHVAWTTDDLDLVSDCIQSLEKLRRDLSLVFPTTAASIKDFVVGTDALLRGKHAEFHEFRGWFGRGQQYVSFLRHDNRLR